MSTFSTCSWRDLGLFVNLICHAEYWRLTQAVRIRCGSSDEVLRCDTRGARETGLDEICQLSFDSVRREEASRLRSQSVTTSSSERPVGRVLLLHHTELTTFYDNRYRPRSRWRSCQIHHFPRWCGSFVQHSAWDVRLFTCPSHSSALSEGMWPILYAPHVSSIQILGP